MFKTLKHPHVRILGGMAEFIGKTGEIVDKEGKLYRVQLDQPVTIPSVGLVTSDLWEPQMLKVIRSGQKAKVVAIDAAVIEEPVTPAAAEMPETASPAEAAPQPAPEAVGPVAATPAPAAATVSLSAKGEAQRRAGVNVSDEMADARKARSRVSAAVRRAAKKGKVNRSLGVQ